MRQVMALSLISLLISGSLTASAADIESSSITGWHHDESVMKRESGQQGMFDGVKLTGQQRQQMRDLMQQIWQEAPTLTVDDLEAMHRLVIAGQFDEAAVRAQIARMMQAQIARQVEMTRVRNQMYNLLTAEQKAVLEQKHRQRMEAMRQSASIMDGIAPRPPGMTERPE